MKRALWLLLLLSCSQEKPQPNQEEPEPKKEEPKKEEPKSEVLQFKVPEGWTQQTPANKLRKAQYAVPDREKDEGDAEFIYSYFGITGGGTFDENLDRWIAQFAGATRETTKVEDAKGVYPVRFVYLEGTYNNELNYQMIVAAVEAPSGYHYFKLVGPLATVGDWAADFRALVLAAK